ncbi:MAG: D-glycero-beta-D-manno-heptose 1,7-bisphosphate 7-phosphatase [Gammaproteobacteria bacterium]|nr:D-glycero-beta-D-manno-heptose 1,7-bisphosphate 7-phosphatase [Gammaproteobacteria bacterium]
MKLIILDRDGVINFDSDAFIKSPEEWHPIPGSLEAIAKLNQAGFNVLVVSNQSGIARQYFDEAMLSLIHEKFQKLLAEKGGTVEAIFYCPHGPDDHCDCRKPKAGLFHQIEKQYQANLAGVFAVGDSWRDLEAAMTVHAQPVLVLTGKGEQTKAAHSQELLEKQIPIFNNLADFTQTLLSPQT